MEINKKSECKIVQDLLLGYTDNVLNSESKKLVEKHLLECDNCQKKLDEIKEDINNNQNNVKKEIDYLKKIRLKTRLKSIFMAIGIILFICFILYFKNFIIIHNLESKKNKILESSNFYKETRSGIGHDTVDVSKFYFKDGIYKEVKETYSDSGKNVEPIVEYGKSDSDEIYRVNENEKKVIVEKGEISKILNSSKENNQKLNVSLTKKLFLQFGEAFYKTIDTDTYEIGIEYYVFRNRFESANRWECWIDKDTGLTLKEIYRDAVSNYFSGTDIVKEMSDNIIEYKYEFDVIKDEDVALPNLSGYQIEYTNVNFEDFK